MKRLTISLTDELFDQLNDIENKSYFVRELIEMKLNPTYSANDKSEEDKETNEDESQQLNEDLNKIHEDISGLDSRIQSIEGHVESIHSILHDLKTEIKHLKQNEVSSNPVNNHESKKENILDSQPAQYPSFGNNGYINGLSEKGAEYKNIQNTGEFTYETEKESEYKKHELPENITRDINSAQSKVDNSNSDTYLQEQYPELTQTEPDTNNIPLWKSPMENIENQKYEYRPESCTKEKYKQDRKVKGSASSGDRSFDTGKALEKNLLAYIPVKAEIKKDVVINLLSKKYNLQSVEKKLDQLIASDRIIVFNKNRTKYLTRA